MVAHARRARRDHRTRPGRGRACQDHRAGLPPLEDADEDQITVVARSGGQVASYLSANPAISQVVDQVWRLAELSIDSCDGSGSSSMWRHGHCCGQARLRRVATQARSARRDHRTHPVRVRACQNHLRGFPPVARDGRRDHGDGAGAHRVRIQVEGDQPGGHW